MASLTPPAPLSPDLVIVGGGMAGVMAALAARTPGNRVLLIEPSNVLGGQGTAGGVAGFCGDSVRVNQPFAELVRRLARHGLIEPYQPNADRRAYDLEWCAFFLQEMVVEAGVDVLLHSRVVGAAADRGRVQRLTVATAGEVHEVTPRFVIDASGACIVPHLTGFPVVHEGANRQLPMSLYFTLWDTGRPVTPVLPEGCPRWRNDDEIPMTSLHRFPSGKVEVKMKVVGFDAADGLSRSAAEIFARRQMHGLIYYLQTVGYRGRRLDTHVLASVSRGIGVREERRILGEHVLTEAEARCAVIFPDAVAVNTYHIDFHWPDRAQRAGTGVTDMLDPHHLPLRMLIPRGARNLLVAGRGASGDQTAMSAFRVMTVAAQMGFAAGHAARQCLARSCELAAIDVPALQAAIEAGGQSLDLSGYGEYLRCDLWAHEEVGSKPPGGSELVIAQGRHACFHLGWRQAGPAGAPERVQWFAERREKRWTAPTGPGPETAAAGAAVALDEGRQLRVGIREGTLWTELSSDGGTTWRAGAVLSVEADAAVRPAVTATRTGAAIAYADTHGRLKFWHGSVERLAGADLVPAAVRLDAPPDEVHGADSQRA
ncbi:MAG: FAD-dependent oxidoreductase [Verrucomicrobia bacterium]|nr:FAD-dependent oxidoreductase [Verrucomicrobiota bacterium]